MIRNYASYSSILCRISYFSPSTSRCVSALNNRFPNYGARGSLQHEVGNEKSWMVINSCCSRNTCCCGPGRGAAAEESPADRLSSCWFSFRFFEPHRGIPPRFAPAWLRRRKNHHYGVSLRGGIGQSASRPPRGFGSSLR